MWGQVAGAVGSIVSGIMGRNDAEAANQEWWDRTLWQAQSARNFAKRTLQHGRQNMKIADRISDRNVRAADRMSDKNVRLAQKFQARQAEKAWDRTDESALRNRAWAKADYRQQKEDMATQFIRLRRAAKKGGFNPLTAMGSQMIPGVAGGLTSSTYGAASGVGAAPVSAMGMSPMGVSSPMIGDAGTVAVAPMASNEAITGGLYELGMELSGEAAQQRANAQIAADLMKIELEQAKARLAVPAVPDQRTDQAIYGSSLGRQASPGANSRSGVPVMSHAGSIPGASPQSVEAIQGWQSGDVPTFHRPSRYGSANPEELVSTPVGSGYISIQLPDGNMIDVLAGPDGEPLDKSQLSAIAAQAAPQVASTYGDEILTQAGDAYFGGPVFDPMYWEARDSAKKVVNERNREHSVVNLGRNGDSRYFGGAMLNLGQGRSFTPRLLPEWSY